MTKLVVEILNNQVCLGMIGFALIMLPIMGIAIIHKPQIKPNNPKEDE
jgi:hypothetical protein